MLINFLNVTEFIPQWETHIQVWHQLLDDLCLFIPLEVAKRMEKVSLNGLHSPLFEFATE